MRNHQSNLMDLKGMAIVFVSYNLKGYNKRFAGRKFGKLSIISSILDGFVQLANKVWGKQHNSLNLSNFILVTQFFVLYGIFTSKQAESTLYLLN